MGVFWAVQDAAPPTPELDIVPGPAPGKTHGPSRCTAMRKTAFKGWFEASNTRTRRVFRMIAAPILSNLVRIIWVRARAALQCVAAQLHHEGVSQRGEQQGSSRVWRTDRVELS